LLRLVVPTPTPIRGTGSIVIPAERMLLFQESVSRLDAVKDDPDRFFPGIFDRIPEILPGKRIARLDILRLEGDTYLTLPRFETQNGIYRFEDDMDVTSVLQPGRLKFAATSSPEFVAAMQAMNERKEVKINEGGESFLARPLLGEDNMPRGAMVLANQTLRGTSLITPEDEEIFRLYTQQVGAILGGA